LGKSTLSNKYNPDVYSYTRELDRAKFLVLLNYGMVVDTGKLRGFEGRFIGCREGIVKIKTMQIYTALGC